MNLGRDVQRGDTCSTFSGLTLPSPLQILKTPSTLHPVSTQLLASRNRPDGGLDELYHEVPSLDGHKGALFFITETPASTSLRDPEVSQRILYTMVPTIEPQRFITIVTERFRSSNAAEFERVFVDSFGGAVLVTKSRDTDV